MATLAWQNQCRTNIVCVDSYEDGVLRGQFYNPYHDRWVSFKSTTQFLVAMEQALDDMKFPRSFTETRNFAPSVPPPEPQDGNRPDEGKLATFAVRILFRQNTSWQGSVAWLEGRREERFRSALELMSIIDQALVPAQKQRMCPSGLKVVKL